MYRISIFLIILIIAGCASVSKHNRVTDPLPDFDRLWNYGDPKQTEVKFLELIPAAEKSGDLSYHTQLLTQIARTEGLQRRFDDAHKTLDTVESMLTDALTVSRIRYLLERGRVYNSSGNMEKSKPFFLEAWKLGIGTGKDYHAIDAAHMMGIVEPPEKQLDWAEKAMDLAGKTSDQRAKKWLGPLYNNTGWSYHDLKQYDKALALFKKSLKWRQEQNDAQGTRIAKWTIGRTYRSLNRIDQAIEIHLKLEKEIDQKGLDPDGYVYEELGECYLIKGGENAGKYFKLAYQILSKDPWLVDNEPDRLERLKELGR